MLRISGAMRARGLRVWVDTEMMRGSTLDAMARRPRPKSPPARPPARPPRDVLVALSLHSAGWQAEAIEGACAPRSTFQGARGQS